MNMTEGVPESYSPFAVFLVLLCSFDFWQPDRHIFKMPKSGEGSGATAGAVGPELNHWGLFVSAQIVTVTMKQAARARDAAFETGDSSRKAIHSQQILSVRWSSIKRKKACKGLKVFIWPSVCLVWDQNSSTICCQTGCNVSHMSWTEQTSIPKSIFGSVISEFNTISIWETGISGTKTCFLLFLFQYTRSLCWKVHRNGLQSMIRCTSLSFTWYANNICRACNAQQHLWRKIITHWDSYLTTWTAPCIIQRQTFSSCSSNLVK